MKKTPKETPKESPAKRPIDNSFTTGMTPPKIIKREKITTEKKYHKMFLAKTRGHVFEIIYTEDALNPGNDCYAPHTFKLAYGMGEFIDKNGKQWHDLALLSMGIVGVYPRRGPDGSKLMNATFTGTTRWGRRALVRFNNGDVRSTQQIEADLTALINLTVKYNNLIDNGQGRNEYRYGAPVQVLNPRDGDLVSLDHYLTDASVLELIHKYFGEPRPEWFSESEDRASVYFDKFRDTYPPAAHLWGYQDKQVETPNSDEASIDLSDIDRFRA